MKTLENLILLFILFQLTAVAQVDTAGKRKYCMTCIDFKKDFKKGNILVNKRTGIGDTTICFVTGKITDFKNEDIPFASIMLSDKESGKTYSSTTDLDGNYKFFLPPGQYLYTVIYFGYQSFTIDKVSFHSGDIHQISIDIGENNCLKTKKIICPTSMQTEQN